MFVGFDTSNYTTSVATIDNEKIISKRKLLTVKKGERGLRQSDAVFQHTVNMPKLLEELTINNNVSAVGVSTRPRDIDGSYMPCFLVGENTAIAVSKFLNVPLFKTSHQIGHILAALYSTDNLNLINDKFIAFHVSGGTTEALLVTPDKEKIVTANLIAKSNDLKAGQLVDRTGVLLGLDFPCGKMLDEISRKSEKEYKIKPSMDGLNCSLSGVENKVKNMISLNENPCDIAKFAISSILSSLDKMTSNILSEYGDYPLVFSGGVMSNSIISKYMTDKYGASFAKSEFSCDNATGLAVYAKLKL